jgi:hypothetical protein
MAEHVFHNTKVIDKSNHCHWSVLLYQESLAIQRYKPELNHGIKASKELIIFNYSLIINLMTVSYFFILLLLLKLYLKKVNLQGNMPV